MRPRNSPPFYAFTVLMLASNASASDQDLQQWTSLRLEHELFDGVTAGVRARVRFDDDVSSEKDVMVGPSLSLEPIDHLKFALGYDYLCDLQAGSTALFSMAPTYLHYCRRERLVLGTTAGAAGLQGLLLVTLVPLLGANGATIAYAAAMGRIFPRKTCMVRRAVAAVRSQRLSFGPSWQ